MFKKIKEANIHSNVKRVSLFFLSYALIILALTIWHALDTNFEDIKELFRGLIRVSGMSLLAWWLLSLNKKAWWLSVIFTGFISLTGIIGVASLTYMAIVHDSNAIFILIKLILPIYFILHSFVLLCLKETRIQFH